MCRMTIHKIFSCLESYIELFDQSDVGPYITEQGTILMSSVSTLLSSETSSLRVYGESVLHAYKLNVPIGN